MITAVQKWGNSLALRIPKVFAEETRIHDGSAVDLSVQSGNIVIRAVPKKSFTLGTLLKGVTSENLHESVDTGNAVGQEVW